MSHKLSLIEGTTISNSGWNAYQSNPYGNEEISRIVDNIGKIEVPVTSIPSPFAQLHLFETAFEFINKEYRTTRDVSVFTGKTTYHKLISNCLDIFEILFSFETLKLKGVVDISVWDVSELKDLAREKNPGRKSVAETLQIFISNYNRDPRFKDSGITGAFDKFALIYYKNEIIAGTSPYTGFFTVGNKMPKGFQSGFNNREFFSDNVPLYKRSRDFQEFMNIFFAINGKVTESFKAVADYVKQNQQFNEDPGFQDLIGILGRDFDKQQYASKYRILEINDQEVELLGGHVQFLCEPFDPIEERQEASNSDYVIVTKKTLKTKPLALKEGNNKPRWSYIKGPFPHELQIASQHTIEGRVLPGTVIKYPWIHRDDLLSPHLIELGYEVNVARFWMPEGEVKNIILPIKSTYFDFFTIADLKEQLSITKLKTGAIEVVLDISINADGKRGRIKFERTYDYVPVSTIDNKDYGAIINTSLGMGIYPFFKVAENKYNDRYKIIAYQQKGEEIDFHFFRENLIEPASTKIASSSHYRTRPEENYGCITNYHELTSIKRDNNGKLVVDENEDITFDVIGLKIDNKDFGAKLSGILLPEMGEPITLANEESAISFDVGTSNSHVSYRTTGKVETLNNFTGTEAALSPHLVLLNAPVIKENIVQRDLNVVNAIYKIAQDIEFMPSIVGGQAHKFPIPTLVNIDNDTSTEKLTNINVLTNANIPFEIKNLRSSYDNLYSNIKWGVANESSESAKNKLQAFVEQLVWMGRNKILSEGYNPGQTNVIWFAPLSMGHTQESVFKSIWDEVYKMYFRKNAGQSNVYKITESWAPFESHDLSFGAGRYFLNLDIGGGTSDLIIFDDKTPTLSTSFQFAGNNLFKSMNKNNEFDNGFVAKYEQIMLKSFEDDDSKVRFVTALKNSKGLSSTDLISFFFTFPVFAEKLQRDEEFKLLFLIHNVAIFYHSFQVLKMSGIGSLPDNIGLSGNGARLMEITNGMSDLSRMGGVKDLINLLVKKIFDLNKVPNISVNILENPKEATAVGGILGFKSITQGDFKDADRKNYKISLGTNSDLLDTKEAAKISYKNLIEDGSTVIDNVTENVADFFTYFFDDLWFEAGFIQNFGLSGSYSPDRLKVYFTDKNNIRNSIREVVNDQVKNHDNPQLEETMFFYPIKAFLYAFSRIIASNEINNFKG